jgi:D-sedoheptulose 7-phosphate isomerase
MNNYISQLESWLKNSIHAKMQLLENDEQLQLFSKAVTLIVESYKTGGRLYIAGNGGSAADSQHVAAEFVSKLARPRSPLPAEALTTDTSILTAIGNDYGYDLVFSRQIEGKMTKKDVFLGITTSGQSPNILKAFETCRALNIPSVALCGRDGGKAKSLADICLIAPGTETSQIQEVHMSMYHTMVACVENELFPIKESTLEKTYVV